MCERLTEQRKAVQLYLKRHNDRKIREKDLSEDEWDLISDFSTLLKPVEEVSKMFCEDSATVAMQFPLAKMISSALSKNHIPSELIEVRDKMQEVLKAKFFDLMEEKQAILIFFLTYLFRLCGLATFLDPRFKHQIVEDKIEFCKKIDSWITEELGSDGLLIDEEPKVKKSRAESSTTSSIFSLHAFLIETQQERQLSENTVIVHEMLKYKSEACAPLNLDPLDYWRVSILA